MFKILLKVSLLLCIFLFGSNFNSYANNFSIKIGTQNQLTHTVTIQNSIIILNADKYYSIVQNIFLEAIEDFIEEEDDKMFLPCKKHIKTTNYVIAHYANQSVKLSNGCINKFWQKNTYFSFPSSSNIYALFCFFRI